MDFSLTDRQAHIQSLVREFAQQEVAPLARSMDEQGRLAPELVRRMAELGLLGGPLPTEYGGGGWDHVALALAYEELGRVDSSLRGFMTVHTSLVSLGLLGIGNESQNSRYLPRLAAGETIGCYCLTEPNAGSDAAALECQARLDGDRYVLNGEKIWITNGGMAGLAIVFATQDPAARHRGISAFLVETDTPGLQREPMPGKELGHRAADHARFMFKDCAIPADSMLGQPGEGFQVAMAALDHGRLGVAAGALGVARACLDACIEFCGKRRQFGKRIGEFEMIQASLADMAVEVEAARVLVYRAAWLKDQGKPASRATSMAKLYATESAARAAGAAVLIHGGRGYSNEYPVERYYRDIKGLQIYEGTSHIQRIVIARDLLDGATG
ncbi:MAG TPA: acyl-CoA dehydrogenase family protein [Anaerolineales bacterium]